MSFCWTVILPILFGFIILIPCILYSFDISPVSGISLMTAPFLLQVYKRDVNLNTSLELKEEA